MSFTSIEQARSDARIDAQLAFLFRMIGLVALISAAVLGVLALMYGSTSQTSLAIVLLLLATVICVIVERIARANLKESQEYLRNATEAKNAH